MILLKFSTVIFTVLLIQCGFAQPYPYTRANNTGITRVTQIRSIGSYLYGNCFSTAFPTMMSMCRTSRAEGFVFNITLSELLNSYDGYGANVGTNDESLVFVGASRRFQEGFGASVLRGEISNRISTVSPVDQFIGTVVASHYEYTNQSDSQIHYHLVFAQNRTWALHQFTVSDTETRSTSWPVETVAIPTLASCFSAANPGDIFIRAAPYIQPQRLNVWIRNAGPTCSNLFEFSLAFDRFMFRERSSVAAVSQAGPNTYWVGARQFCRMFLDGQVARILSCRSAPSIEDVQAIAVHEPSQNLYMASLGRISTANGFIPIEDMVVDSMVTLDDELLWTATDTSGNSFTYLAKYSSFRATWDAPSVQGPIAPGSNVDLFPAMLGFLIAFIICSVLMVIGWTLFIVLKVRLSRTKFERVELGERLMN